MAGRLHAYLPPLDRAGRMLHAHQALSAVRYVGTIECFPRFHEISRAPMSSVPTLRRLLLKWVDATRPLRGLGLRGDLIAVVIFAVALGVRFAVDHLLPPGFPYLTFFPAIILTTFFFGLRPGIVSALLGGVAAWYFFIGPSGSFAMGGPAAIGRLESDGNSGSHAPDSHASSQLGIPSRIQMSDAIH